MAVYRKFKSLRGGFISPQARMSLKKMASRYLKNPRVRAAASAATSYAGAKVMSALKEKLSVTPSGISVMVASGAMSRKVTTPTIYGAYGSVTSTNYVEGASVVTPAYIKEQGRQVDLYNFGLNCDAPVSQQGSVQYLTGSASRYNDIGNNYARLYNSSRTVTNFGKFFVHSIRREIKLSNSSNVGCTLEVYEIVPKESLDYTGSVQSPITAWTGGYLEQSPAGIPGSIRAVNSITQYGASPFDCDAFSQYYSVKKVFNIELPGGTTHVHDATYNIGKTFDCDMIINAFATGSFRDFSKWVLVVAKGNPVHDISNSDIVGTSPIAIDITVSEKIITYGMPGSTTISGINAGFDIPSTPQAYTQNVTEQAAVVD